MLIKVSVADGGSDLNRRFGQLVRFHYEIYIGGATP
jgi:hypothetical protein